MKETPMEPGEDASLNPQPIPPGREAVRMAPGEAVSLNPQPIPPGRQALYRALGDLTASAFLDADGPSGDIDPRGPGGPVMRDVAVALALTRIGTLLRDDSHRREIEDLASRILAEAVQERR
jgi:hypothetical protein